MTVFMLVIAVLKKNIDLKTNDHTALYIVYLLLFSL